MSSDEQLDYMIDGLYQKNKQLADENLRLRGVLEDALWKQHRIRINIDEGHTCETVLCPRCPDDDAEFWPCSDPDDPKECILVAWVENPQAAQIDALIERAGRLTDGEIKRLEAAWDAAWAAAWDAAQLADRDVAFDAARDAAREAAREAARALVVRDLIEEGTPWDWAAYDVLTGPWRRVIGPIHPDDEVLR